jgi:hypothetical protein
VSVPILNSKILKDEKEEERKADEKMETVDESKSGGMMTDDIKTFAEVPAIIMKAENYIKASVDAPIEISSQETASSTNNEAALLVRTFLSLHTHTIFPSFFSSCLSFLHFTVWGFFF